MVSDNAKYEKKICVWLSREQYEFLEFLKDMWNMETISDVVRALIDGVRMNLMMNYPLFAIDFKRWRIEREEKAKTSEKV